MIYAFEDFELDTLRFELRRGGTRVPLERQVYDVLAYLVQNHERLVTKEEIIDSVWGDRFVTEAALNSRVMAARKALGDSGKEQRLIRTAHGRGYQFVGEVSVSRPVPGAGGESTHTAPAAVTREQEIRFCTAADGVKIAYALVGQGPPLVKAANWLSHLEFDWRSPIWRHWIEELSRDHTYVRYDERGFGLSDWEIEDWSLDAWVRDLETVVDVLGLESFPLLGISQGGAVAINYAIRHPERVSHLILYGAYAQGKRLRARSPEDIEELEAVITLTRTGWGRDNPAYRQMFATSFVPGANQEQMRWFNDLCRVSASPENAVRFQRLTMDVDVTGILEQVRVPTLVLHARNDQRVHFDQGRILASSIPGARFVPLEGSNHILLEDEPAWRAFLSEVRKFLGVVDHSSAVAREDVHTILFTDIVDSTGLMQRLGDEAGRAVLREHEEAVRGALRAHGGSQVKSLGDGFMATFPSATRALECAIAIQRATALQEEGSGRSIEVRIGLNTGEPIEEEGDLFGTSVIVAARVAAKALGGEILVTDVVRQLVAGKGFQFTDRGQAVLRGIEEPARLYEVRWRE